MSALLPSRSLAALVRAGAMSIDGKPQERIDNKEDEEVSAEGCAA